MAKSKNKAWWLFGDERTFEAVALYDPSFQQIEALKKKGFKLIWDSAPSKDKAYQYAADHGDGEAHYFPTQCPFCNGFRPVNRVRGQKWSANNERWVVYNGTVCDMCVEDTDILKVKVLPEKQKVPS